MEKEETNLPEEYRILLKKVEALEKALGLHKIEEIVADQEESSEDLSVETITEDILQIQQRPQVLINPKAYLKMAKHALTYANPSIPAEEWVEVIGLLTGNIKHEETPLEQIFVEDYWPVGQGDAVTVEIVDQRIFTEIFEKKSSENFICGWAHSHPSYTPFLSDEDLGTHRRYQVFWNKSIALVIDPLMIADDNYGIGVFRIRKDKRNYYELTTEIKGMSTEACYESISMFMKNQLDKE